MTTANPTQTNTRWQEIVNIWQKDKWLYGLVGLVTGVIVGIAAADYLSQLVTWFASGFWNEALSIAIIIFVLDKLIQFRYQQMHKEEVMCQLWNDSNAIPKQTAYLLRHKGYLTDGSLENENLEAANFYGADLRKANLQHTNLRKANLQTTNLMLANLQGASLILANLQDAKLHSANLTGAYLGSANLEGTKLPSANLQDTTLANTNLQDAVLWNANLQRANMSGANLRGVDLYLANLENADLSFAMLQGADLRKANLVNVTWLDEWHRRSSAPILPDGTKWEDGRDMRAFTDEEHPDYKRTLERIKAIRDGIPLHIIENNV